MSKGNGEVMTVTILPNTKSGPQGKLADAEAIFGAASGPLNGLRLIGFAVPSHAKSPVFSITCSAG